MKLPPCLFSLCDWSCRDGHRRTLKREQRPHLQQYEASRRKMHSCQVLNRRQSVLLTPFPRKVRCCFPPSFLASSRCTSCNPDMRLPICIISQLTTGQLWPFLPDSAPSLLCLR